MAQVKENDDNVNVNNNNSYFSLEKKMNSIAFWKLLLKLCFNKSVTYKILI